MPAKPSTNKCDKHNSMVNRHIGTAYDTVKIVADNIDEILEVGENLDYLLNYLGAYSTHPTERPNGDPLQDGDYYFNTVDNALVYYDLGEDVWFTVDPQEVLDARDEAIAARDAAQLAQAGAETAETNAAASESAAATSEANAALSESNAAVSETNAATSEANAATSASNAETSKLGADASAAAAAVSESNAATSELNAATSASEALASENAAESSEIAAANSAVSAAQSAADAEAAFDNFNDMYLGAFAVDPTEDNDGNPLQVGATYWNTVENEQRFWSGAVWDTPSATAEQAANDAIAARDDAQLSETNAANSELAAAASATDAATSEANASASELNAATSETNASNSAAAALTSEANAATSETNAATSEANALASENKAEQWAEEAEDVEVEPSKYSAKHWATKAADSAGDVTWKVHTRGEAELNQMREQTEDARAASGFDGYGNHVDDISWGSINEGLWVPEETSISGVYSANTLHMGVVSGNAEGTSPTVFAKTAIAGFISDLDFNQYNPSRGGSGDDWCRVKFPDAPDGTVIFDVSGDVRGSGEGHNLDLTTDIDPKYGDVAGSHSEAVARAFEGMVKNGSFQNDVPALPNTSTGGNWFIAAGTYTSALISTGGLRVVGLGQYGAVRQDLRNEMLRLGSPDTLRVSCTIPTSTDSISLYLYYNGAYNPEFNAVPVDGGRVEFEVDVSDWDGSSAFELRLYTSGAGGVDFTCSGVTVVPVGEEVVTNRFDTFGGEFFLEEVSLTNPYVYPKGMIQSQAPTMNGITTVASARPATYYAVFTGDTGSAGLGVDFWAATDQEKIDMVSDHSNNIFLLADGRVVQWRMRQRTFRGYGNGNWYNTKSTGDAIGFQTVPFLQPAAQGINDSVNDYFISGEDPAGFYGTTNTTPIHNDPGVFRAGISGNPTNTVAVDGQCYLQIWGRVRRLNTGSHHPSHNTLGASQTVNSTLTGWTTWESNSARNTYGPKDCFTDYTYSDFGTTNVSAPVGSIANGLSGRRDGRLFDAIYASGDGGVNDDRLPSWDVEEEVGRVKAKVIDGSFRGEERRQFWKIVRRTRPSASSSALYPSPALKVDSNDMVGGTWDSSVTVATNMRGAKCWVRIISAGSATLTAGTTLNTWYVCDVLPHPSQRQILLNPNTGTTRWIDAGSSDQLLIDIAGAVYTDNTISDSFMQTDVIGYPGDITNHPDLMMGWEGGWLGNPQGSGGYSWLKRDADSALMAGDAMIVLQGSNTTYYTRAIDFVRNRVTSVGTTGDIGVINYLCRAYRTKENAGRKYVLGGYDHAGSMYATAHNDPTRGGALRESFLGVVDAGYSGEFPHSETKRYMEAPLLSGRPNGSSGTSAFEWVHPQTTLGQPTYSTQAMKTAMYPFSTNREVGLAFMWNELRWIGDYTNLGVIEINDGTVGTDGVVGNVYRTHFTDPGTGSAWNNRLLKCVNAFTASWNDAWVARGCDRWGRNQYAYITAPTGGPMCRDYGTKGDLWGDRGSIWICDDYPEIFTDDNGTELPAGNHILSKPMGYTKNKARIGTQFPGTDL